MTLALLCTYSYIFSPSIPDITTEQELELPGDKSSRRSQQPNDDFESLY